MITYEGKILRACNKQRRHHRWSTIECREYKKQLIKRLDWQLHSSCMVSSVSANDVRSHASEKIWLLLEASHNLRFPLSMGNPRVFLARVSSIVHTSKARTDKRFVSGNEIHIHLYLKAQKQRCYVQ